MPNEVVDRVHALARTAPIGMTFTNLNNVEYPDEDYDSDSDYDSSNDESDSDDDDDDGDDNSATGVKRYDL